MRDEISEADEREPPAAAQEHLRRSVAVVGIEMGYSQLEDMGVVFAYELARYLAQKSEGIICNDEDMWLRVIDGAFDPIT